MSTIIIVVIERAYYSWCLTTPITLVLRRFYGSNVLRVPVIHHGSGCGVKHILAWFRKCEPLYFYCISYVHLMWCINGVRASVVHNYNYVWNSVFILVCRLSHIRGIIFVGSAKSFYSRGWLYSCQPRKCDTPRHTSSLVEWAKHSHRNYL